MATINTGAGYGGMGFGRVSGRGSAKQGAGAYARVGVESAALSASPHGLIVMLFDGLLMQIRKARLHMENGNMAEKGMAVSRALDILHQGLLAALDREQGGQLADNLGSLYEYCGRLLLQASVSNDQAKLDEAHNLLEEIAGAWREIAIPVGEEPVTG